jgi:glucose dehydrogenase
VSHPRSNVPAFADNSFASQLTAQARHTGRYALALGALLSCQTADCAAIHGIDNAALSATEAGTEWAGYGRTFDQQRFSPLTDINTTNIQRLGLVSWLDLPDIANVSSAPLEAQGIVYFAAGLSVVHAVDAVSGKLLWKYDPHVTGPKMRLAWGSRGCTISRNGPTRFRVNGPTSHGLPAEPRLGSFTRPFSLKQVFWL